MLYLDSMISRFRAWTCGLLLTAATIVTSAGSEAERYNFDIPASDAETSLPRFSSQVGERERLLYSADAVGGVRTNAVQGQLTAGEALRRLVEGTRLKVMRDEGVQAYVVTAGGREQSVTPDALDKKEIVRLTAFQVNAADDVGYRAGNSVSGSRFNTSLKDTAAQVAVFTPEFIMDLGANNLEDVMQYSANFQTDTDDSSSDMSGSLYVGVDKGSTDTRFRVRNLAGSRAMDFFESQIVNDNYNVGRFEVVSGPNSILFGFGSPGGIVNTVSKRALTTRNFGSYRLQVGSWERLRNEFDFNQVIKRDRLAVRAMAVKESVNSWRTYGFSEQERATIAGTYRPLEKTTLSAMYEKGRTARHLEVPSFNAFDGYALWEARGRIVKDGYNAAIDRPNGINRITAVRPVFIENNGTFLNDQNRLETTFENLNLPVSQRAGFTMLSPDKFPYDVSNTGPAARAWQKLRQGRILLEQRVTDDFTVEFAYNKMWNFDESHSPNGASMTVAADPNLTVPGPNGALVANPNAGRRYLESNWLNDSLGYDTEHWRATAAYELDLGQRFGRHRIAGMFQTEDTALYRSLKAQVLIDSNGNAINNAFPENGVNRPRRRNYLTEGATDTYYGGRVDLPFEQTINGRTFTTRWIPGAANGQNRTRKEVDTHMVALQSFFWNGRITGLFGYRLDNLSIRRADVGRVAAGDPRIATGDVLLNQWDILSTSTSTDYKPTTRNLGGVFHATKHISIFYNRSSNVGQPVLNLYLVPDNRTPPPTQGSGHDYGISFDLLDGRIFARINRYETSAEDEARAGTNIITNPGTRIMDTLLTSGFVSQDEYDRNLIIGNGGLTDSFAEGTEFTLTANLRSNWALQLNYSHNQQSQENYFLEAEAAVREAESFWRDRLRAAGVDASAISTTGLTGSQGTIDDEIAVIYRELAITRTANELGFGRRSHKANLFTRYTFQEGWKKGFLVGGGARYQSKSFNQRDLVTGRDYWGDPIFQVDLLLGYRSRLPRFKGIRPLDFSVQLNVSNVLNDDEPLVARLNDLYTGPRRVYFQEPRSFRLTATVSY